MAHLNHYLEQFLSLGWLGSAVCQQNLEQIVHVCEVLGIPLALERLAGIIIDTHQGVLLATHWLGWQKRCLHQQGLGGELCVSYLDISSHTQIRPRVGVARTCTQTTSWNLIVETSLTALPLPSDRTEQTALNVTYM